MDRTPMDEMLDRQIVELHKLKNSGSFNDAVFEHLHRLALVVDDTRMLARAALKRGSIASEPIPMRLTCPTCGELHLDEGEFATKPHHTHACQSCGEVWRPALLPTVGVRFLPGFKNGGTDLSVALSALADEPTKGRSGDDFSERLDHVLYGLPSKKVGPGVAVRIRNSLTNAGILTLEQLTSTTLSDLRKLKNLGESSVTQIQRALAHFGLTLAMSRTPSGEQP